MGTLDLAFLINQNNRAQTLEFLCGFRGTEGRCAPSERYSKHYSQFVAVGPASHQPGFNTAIQVILLQENQQ